MLFGVVFFKKCISFVFGYINGFVEVCNVCLFGVV